MMYLFLSIFFTVLVFVILKEFNRYQLDNLQAIVVSYFLAFAIGYFFSEVEISVPFLITKDWVFGAVAIAIIFIIVFNLMALTAQKGGLSVMTVANKMSVVIPIVAGIVLYNESIGIVKLIGIVFALLGVWFTSKKSGAEKFDKRLWYLPLLIFIGSGLADTLLNHMQTHYVPSHEFDIFSTSLFLFCGLIGVLVFSIRLFFGNTKISPKSWLGGLALGAPNYFSIYFFIKALSQKEYGTALIFSANNLLVVLLSVLLGLFLYKEKLSKLNYFGLGMSLIAIVFLSFAL
ncbi:EamA family transporter [Wenyingzhuangia sp. 2_MG-2023]|uniref:EamA family transporter n=1 Tax=Wenyingzhuangia sp. 2_MG-2023 TaxID=3062639 RepID=UPI0026E22F16|nr:EamA family transporter [Wenyingzhuangia sp. 2_MG-2023]MDO6736962.1 EamA family transporter [Wenyingzhuangia sp. 2_MG-2023]